MGWVTGYRTRPMSVDTGARETGVAAERGRAAIFYEGTNVRVPVGKRRDGEWSRRAQIVAIFLDRREAETYAEAKRAQGVPAEVDGRGGSEQ